MNELEWLRELLEEAHDTYNRQDFISDDPVSVPHSFSKKEDIELAGFFSALIAWGNRLSILKSARRLMSLMDQSPFDFVMDASGGELARLDTFIHRTFNGVDARGMVLALRRVYREEGGLEGIFSRAIDSGADNVGPAIVHARTQLIASELLERRSYKHLADPASGSSAKRLNMYLRWMVRKDKRGVDFGIWSSIGMQQLICPLDVHTGTMARELGLLQRKQNDWQAAQELTQNLRLFSVQDPVRYDFSLFGLGVSGAWKARMKST
jgi:uncharacterized protein (TIGR02757 family)